MRSRDRSTRGSDTAGFDVTAQAGLPVPLALTGIISV